MSPVRATITSRNIRINAPRGIETSQSVTVR
jgi:hypothetical protein